MVDTWPGGDGEQATLERIHAPRHHGRPAARDRPGAVGGGPSGAGGTGVLTGDRLDLDTGEINFIEINLNCNLWSEKVMAKAAQQAGSVKTLFGRARDWFLGNF